MVNTAGSKSCGTRIKKYSCATSRQPGNDRNTYFHLVHLLIVFAESVIIFVIFNAKLSLCNLILICWTTASKGFCSSTWESCGILQNYDQ